MQERRPALASLRLRRNGVGDEGATALAGALCGNRSLTALDLGGNAITKTGARALKDATAMAHDEGPGARHKHRERPLRLSLEHNAFNGFGTKAVEVVSASAAPARPKSSSEASTHSSKNGAPTVAAFAMASPLQATAPEPPRDFGQQPWSVDDG